MTAQDTIRARARELLESGEVATFIGWEAGRFENQTTPIIITKKMTHMCGKTLF